MAIGPSVPSRRDRQPPGRTAEPGHLSGPAVPLAAGALAATLLVVASPLPTLAAVLPALVFSFVASSRWPAAAVVGVIFLTGTAGTMTAFTPIPPNGTMNLLLLGLWAGVAVRLWSGRYERPLCIWPGILLPALFIATVALWALLGSDSFRIGFESFRISAWFMLAFLLVAIAPWSSATQLRIARGAASVFLVVGAYAVFRKVVGPAGAEITVARANAVGLPFSQPAPFTGSFLHAQHLGAWSAFAIPFALALALGWRDRWRLVAIIAVAVCSIGLLAADRRAATVGALLGVAVTLALFVVAARAFRGPRIATAAIAVAALVGLGSAGYMATIAQDPDSSARFEALVTAPEEDEAYQARLSRWQVVVNSLDSQPLGHGLGSVGAVLRQRTDLAPDAVDPNLDSSFLKIAYEQGLGPLLLFAISYLALLGGLAWRATQTADRGRAVLAIGACGTLAAMLPPLYSSMLIEAPTVTAGWVLVGLGAAAFTRVAAQPTDRRTARSGAQPAHRDAGSREPTIPVGGAV